VPIPEQRADNHSGTESSEVPVPTSASVKEPGMSMNKNMHIAYQQHVIEYYGMLWGIVGYCGTNLKAFFFFAGN